MPNFAMLKDTKVRLHQEIKRTLDEIEKAELSLALKREQLRQLKIDYAAVDRKLAMRDGRFQRIVKKRKEEKKEIELTVEQIQSVASRLGIKIV
jgi:hypothetical protein